MLYHKDIHNSDERQSLLHLKGKTIDLLVDYISFFDFRSITSRFDTVKKKGYSFFMLQNSMGQSIEKPNTILILADDLGIADLSPLVSNYKTP